MRLALAVAVLCCASCARDPVVATFEDFYAATVARDLRSVRALLCPTERRVLNDVADDVVLAQFSVKVVVRDVVVTSVTGAAATVTVTDALGKTAAFQLRSDQQAPRGWCVAGSTSTTATP